MKRRYRDTVGVYGDWGGGVPLPSRLEGLGSVVSSISLVQGGAPVADACSALFKSH